MPFRHLLLVITCTLTTAFVGCSQFRIDPAMATRPYPRDLHRPEAVDIQVFRKNTNIQLVNATATTYTDFDLWLNQRYVHRVPSLEAGETITVSLWNFWDERGERFNAGGILRAYAPTPVRLTEIQTAEDQPTIGLVTIRAEKAD